MHQLLTVALWGKLECLKFEYVMKVVELDMEEGSEMVLKKMKFSTTQASDGRVMGQC